MAQPDRVVLVVLDGAPGVSKSSPAPIKETAISTILTNARERRIAQTSMDFTGN